MFRKVLSVVGCLVGVLPLACTEFEPGTDELAPGDSFAEASSGALTPGVGRDWSCIGDLVQEEAGVARATANAGRLIQSLQVLSLAAGTVPPDVSVRACTVIDVGCAAPVTPDLPLDAQGWVDLPLYEGFDGYLEITGPTLVPALMFYQYPLSADSRRDTAPLGLVERALLPMLTAAIGTPQDPMLGLLTLRAFDCKGDEAPGVQVSIDKPGVGWYFVSGLPSAAPTETEGSGLGGFLNVPSGITVAQFALTSREREIALPKALVSRPGWMTSLRLIPGLRPASITQ